MTDRLNPEALEAAANAVRRIALGEVDSWDTAEAAVSAYLAALPAPRIITTVEELGAMPTSAYVEDMHGDRGVVFNEHIWYPETKPIKLGYALKHYGPFTVLWVPTEGDQP